MLVGAPCAGLLAGGFTRAVQLAERFFQWALAQWPLGTLLAAPLALAAVAVAAQRLGAGVSGSGMPQLLGAVRIDDGALRRKWTGLRESAGRALMTLLALACGASVGRQGPTVALCASLLRAAGAGLTHRSPDLGRALLTAGAAAGVAAAFNTPLAGLAFACEQIARWWPHRPSPGVLATVALAAILADLSASLVVGGGTHFPVALAVQLDRYAWAAVAACALVAGLAATAFTATMVSMGSFFPRFRQAHPALAALAAVSILSLAALADGHALHGTGEVEIVSFLAGNPVSPLHPLAKAIATLLGFWAGLAGGLFGPSLAIGAGIGAVLHEALPVMPLAQFVFVGIAGFLAAALGAPVTAALVAVELCGRGALLAPALAAAFIAHGLSVALGGQTLYATPARRLLAAAYYRRRASGG